MTELGLPRVVLVDDEAEILAAIKRCLMRVNIEIISFTSPTEALVYLNENEPQLVISDQRMPEVDGYELLDKVKSLWPNTKRIMLSAYQDFDQVSKGFNEGIIDKFISKPWNNAELVFTVEDAVMEKKSTTATTTSQSPSKGFNIIGQSSQMLALLEQITLAAGANVPIFVHGETGTGKELVAKACHHSSYRASEPFIAVNCANFSEQLIDAQLFGAVKGAYTGAVSDSEGIFAQADGGTVFLDEIATLPMSVQAKLLRVLQEREYTPLGGTKVKSFNSQIVSASSMRLSEAVANNEFREDLFYRLNVIPLSLPPLRERGQDKLLLAQYFLEKYAKEQGKPFSQFSDEAKQMIFNHHWPGNVRQLENTLHGACVMNTGEVMNADMLSTILSAQTITESQSATPSISPVVTSDTGQTPTEIQSLAETEKQAIEAAIAHCDGNISQAAALLNVNPSTIYRKMQKWT